MGSMRGGAQWMGLAAAGAAVLYARYSADAEDTTRNASGGCYLDR